jgi:hypothetical protein
MNVDIGADAALFPEKEYIKVIFVAVQAQALQKRDQETRNEAGVMYHLLLPPQIESVG